MKFGKKYNIYTPRDIDKNVHVDVMIAIIRFAIIPIFIFFNPYAIPTTKLSKLEDKLNKNADKSNVIYVCSFIVFIY
jgi:hypothetical protein